MSCISHATGPRGTCSSRGLGPPGRVPPSLWWPGLGRQGGTGGSRACAAQRVERLVPLRPGRGSGEGWARRAGSGPGRMRGCTRVSRGASCLAARPLLRDAAACACRRGPASPLPDGPSEGGGSLHCECPGAGRLSPVCAIALCDGRIADSLRGPQEAVTVEGGHYEVAVSWAPVACSSVRSLMEKGSVLSAGPGARGGRARGTGVLRVPCASLSARVTLVAADRTLWRELRNSVVSPIVSHESCGLLCGLLLSRGSVLPARPCADGTSGGVG